MATQSNILASGKLHGQRSLTGYSLWGCKELNTTKYARTAVPPVVCFFVHLEKPQFSSVQSLSHVWLFMTPGTAAHQGSLSITNSQSLLKLIESVMPSNHLILCRPFSSYLQSFPASGSFLVSQFFASGGQSIGVSALESVLQWIFRTDLL